MSNSLSEKFEKLSDLLSLVLQEPPAPAERGVLLIYSPEQEIEFRSRLDVFLMTMQSQKIPHEVVDTKELPFACLEAEELLEDAFRLEAEDPSGLRQYLASELPRLLLHKVVEASSKLPVGAAIIIKSPSSLFPWVRFADFLSLLPTGFRCRVIVPFPGHERGAYLHFLDHRDGFNYLARRIN